MTLQVAIPSIDELADNYLRYCRQRLAETGNVASNATAADIALARSNLQAMGFATGAIGYGNYQFLRDFVARQAIPTTSTREYLDAWLNAYGLPRKQAQPARGAAGGTGVAGEPLPANTELQSDTGAIYVVQEDAVVAADQTVSPRLIAVTPGAAGNLAPGSKLTLVATVAGIDAEFVVTAMDGGTDREKDEEAIYRLHQRLANPPLGSAPADYERWALSCPGITRAWCIRNPSGPCTVAVVIMADNNAPYGLPTEAQRQFVFDYIRADDRGPPDELFVIIPTAKVVDIVLQIEPDTMSIRDGITLELKDLFWRESIPGGRIPYTHLSEAVSVSPGEFDHVFIEPVIVPGDGIIAGPYEIAVVGSITFTAAP